ncbi:Bax inhibitor-1/YccA family protein [Candidatus Bandiella euplotis]|uniref:Bax inhibitor-1/YccA family protein n=1 Tax=Candidatus Bandiella euplotis TaxID=1664265 RepID=A0ABZ0UM00_9RICK|nr:Bax inhibitor-1/YccA family protein [Candidatus Bandiella woodruffii]WPX97151.1 Bax inhibitor-1/YccA family protein [Candidatus Bandiella woodruffii]
MLDYTNYAGTTTQRSGYDEGLRTYMISVFQNMGVALAITAIISMLVASSPSLMQVLFGTPLQWVVVLAPLGMVFFMSAKIMTMSVQSARVSLWVFSGLMGVSLSSIFYVYTQESIAKVFFITASLFGAMAIYGHSTKKDLSGMGSFLIMGLMGLVIASLANLFFQSSALGNVLSYVGVVIFTLLTAYDVQKLKVIYYNVGVNSDDVAQRISVYGALNLYMDFINLFLFLLRIFGTRRD